MQRWESFHFDGRHCGALFRDITPERLLTRVAFPLDEDEAYLVESVIMRDELSWQSMTYWQQSGDLYVTAERGDHSDASMPGYGEFLLLERMRADQEEHLAFEAIIDSAPEGPSATAWMQLTGPVAIPSPNSRQREGRRIDVTIGDIVTSSHWVQGDRIVASDWKGAQSFLQASADEALRGVDQELVDFLREGRSALPARRKADVQRWDRLAGEMNDSLLPRTKLWAHTMHGHGDDVVTAHATSHAAVEPAEPRTREFREEAERLLLNPAASFSVGAGDRATPEEPDALRTCFERDRDRVVHSTAFRRLAGKTQVVVYPTDHQRTRLTHAIEVAQCAVAMARGIGANVPLVDAMALGHDCGHGPGGHASEDAFDQFIQGGYDHGPWGADVVLADLNLCRETLDGIRNHSWSRPAPSTLEGELVSWADRIAYCAHDLEDAIHAGIVVHSDLPDVVSEVVGTSRRQQLSTFLNAVISTTMDTGTVGMDKQTAEALAALRRFNYERIYTRPESTNQSRVVVRVLTGLVEYYLQHPGAMPGEYRTDEAVRGVVTYVGGMTDRFAFEQAQRLLGWDPAQLPAGIGRNA